MPSLNIRLSDQELLELRGRARMGRRSLQKQVVYELFHRAFSERDQDGAKKAPVLEAADTGVVESAGQPTASIPAVAAPVSRSESAATLYAKDCRNADYHYKGPCRFCGGGNPL